MITLVLEASTYAGSAAVIDGARILAERAVAMRGREHEALMPSVAEVLADAGVGPRAIERVVCGAGPGSFTSLRIAGAIAKGISLAAVCPLVPPLASHGALAMTQDELREWGRKFGRSAHAPLVVTISGELGAGKTTLVQAICAGYGVKEDVTSPTYALVHEYDAPRSAVHHLDLYRLDSPSQLDALAWDEIVSARALVLVEWPERAGDRLPGSRVTLSLQHLPDDPDRRLLYAGHA